MTKKTQPILALSIFLLFINILFISFFFGSSLYINNRTIRALPSTSNINRYEWNKIWGGSDYDCGRGIALDGSGNAFITGSTSSFGEGYSDVFLLKYDSSGTLQWNKTWGGPNDDYGHGIALDGSGNAFITGSTESYEDGNDDAFLLKYDASGNLLWNKTWGGSNYDYGHGIALDGSGNAFITGSTHSYGAGYYDAFLLKYDTSGNLLWYKTWGGSNDDIGKGIALDGSGNAFITGSTRSYGAGDNDAFLLKYDTSGNLLWNKTWGGSFYDEDIGYGIALDGSGNAFITGYTRSYGAGDNDAFLLKYDTSGNLLWYKTWGGSGSDYGEGISLDASGNAFITGDTRSYGAGNYDVFFLKYDSSGNLLWYKTWGGSDNDRGYGIAVDSSGNAFITGYTDSYGEGYSDAFLLKYGFDTDDDGLSDLDEVNIYFTDPNNADTDGDGQNDGDEIALGFDPNNPLSNSFITVLTIIISIVIIISSLIFSYIRIKSYLKKKKIEEINAIIKDGDDLITKSNLDKAIESYQKAYSEAVNILTSRKNNEEFQTIRVKLDETLTLRIDQILEEVIKLQNEGECIRSIENVNLALNLTKKIKEKSLEKQFNSKIINILDRIYAEIIEGKIEEALKLRKINNFNESINLFKNALSEINKISDKELKDQFQSILKGHLNTTRINKTKSVIFDLGQNYTRLEVSDIIEKCGEEEGLIISAIQDMIKNREISAEYFKSSKAIAFKQQVDIEEIDKLMKSFDEWEKEGKGKKN
jgi:tetratricopeptide (TPR) repeat protein